MNSRLSRRQFLKHSTAAGLGFTVINSSRTAFGYAANDKVNVALIGVSGRGSWFVKCMPNLANIVAMCDVNKYRANPVFERFPDARKFKDFREMLAEMGSRLDAVTIAVPDNTHAVISAAAMKAGKGVLCEKPLTHDVFEARTLRKIANETKVATQMGDQGTGSNAFRECVELVQAGVLGEIREVHAWNTGGGAGERPLPTDEHELPDYLDYDLWLGPAKYRPYNSRWLQWHTWRDFATGNLGNWACHTMNLPFKALKLDTFWSPEAAKKDDAPLIHLEVAQSGVHKATFPKWEIVHYHFPARGEMPPVTVHWYNGSGKAPGPRDMIEKHIGYKLDWGDAGEKRWADHAGVVLMGEKASIHSTGHNMSYKLLPQDKFKNFEMPPRTLPRSRGHEREWLDAVKGGPTPMSNFNYSGPLAEFVLLGNVATLVGRDIEYDAAKMEIPNDEQANAALRREYREGWSL